MMLPKSVFIFLLIFKCFDCDIRLSTRKSTPKLFKSVSQLSEGKNVVVSPLSISMLMYMIYSGAEDESLSKNQLARAFNFYGNESESIKSLVLDDKIVFNGKIDRENSVFKLANAVFASEDLNLEWEFEKLIKDYFLSDIQQVDFTQRQEAAQRINDWVSKKTNNLVKDLISPSSLDDYTKLVLTNIIYFKSQWKYPFDKSLTARNTFNKVSQADYMNVKNEIESSEIPELSSTLVILPYIDEKYQMLIFHPNQNSSIETLEKKLFRSKNGVNSFEAYRSRAKKSPIDLSFPKFEVEFQTSLVRVCNNLSVNAIFSDNAKLSKISRNVKDLSVSDIIHKSRIIVDEEGSEAAAASGVILETRVGTFIYKEVNINSPFIFIIYDTANKMSLFVGKIINPAAIQDPEVFGVRKNDEDVANDDHDQDSCVGGGYENCVAETCNSGGLTSTRAVRSCIAFCDSHCSRK